MRLWRDARAAIGLCALGAVKIHNARGDPAGRPYFFLMFWSAVAE